MIGLLRFLLFFIFLFPGIALEESGGRPEAPPIPTVPEWRQCGGRGWIGSARCAPGLTCVYINIEYSQCQLGTSPPVSIPLPTEPVRVLALGDDITHGGGTNSYRAYLKDLLAREKLPIDYIGSQNCGPMKDNQCEGHPGKTVDEIDEYVNNALAQDPHIILLHAGLSELLSPSDPDLAITRLRSLISHIHTSSNATILMGEMTPILSVLSDVGYFNSRVWAIVALPLNLGERILHVSMAALDESDVSMDGVHPNKSGYQKMAQAWYIGWHYARDRMWIP
ncbi:lipolytic enzyme [Coprinopsis sp. MPI-PUGE-AT-0042]|nr:lipolytic enzyme [Coprinopsis sp. MPI-PUGE-AT-0042]